MPGRRGTLEERFWPKVDQRSPDECWPWTAATNSGGYGVIRDDSSRLVLAHRVSVILDGRDPGDATRHACDHPWCVNPAHVEGGTQAQNVEDAVSRLRYAGAANGQAKLTDADVAVIRARVASGETQTAVRTDYGLGIATVSDIVNFRRWAHVA